MNKRKRWCLEQFFKNIESIKKTIADNLDSYEQNKNTIRYFSSAGLWFKTKNPFSKKCIRKKVVSTLAVAKETHIPKDKICEQLFDIIVRTYLDRL